MSQATIGSALVERRRELGLEKGQAADKIDMSRTTYSSYEQDAQRPSVDVFPALAGFLDVSMEVLLTLYGATCVAAVRPTLEKILSSHHGDLNETTTLGEPTPVIDELAPSSSEEPIELPSVGPVDAPDNVVTEGHSLVSDGDIPDHEATEFPESGGAVELAEAAVSPTLHSQQTSELERTAQPEEPSAARKPLRSSAFEPSTSIFKRELSDGSEQYQDVKKKKKKKKKKKN